MFGRAHSTDDGPGGDDADRVEMLPVHGSPFVSDEQTEAGDRPGGVDGSSVAPPWEAFVADSARNRRGWIIGTSVLAVLVLAVVAVSIVADDGGSGIAGPEPSASSAAATAASVPAVTEDAGAEDEVPTPPSIIVNSADDPFALDPRSPIGFVLGRPPDGLTQVSAYSFPNEAGGNSLDGDLQLWATPGASRTTGAWLLAQTHRLGAEGGFWPGGRRVAIGSSTGLLVTAPDGVRELRFTIQTTDQLTAKVVVMAFGLPVDSLVAIASTIVVGVDGLFTMEAPPQMINALHSRSLPFGVLDGPRSFQYSGTVTSTHYARPTTDHAPSPAVLSIAAAEISIDIAALVPFLLINGRQEDLGGRMVWIGGDPAPNLDGRGGDTMAVFVATGRAVVVWGDVDGGALRNAVESVRLASNDVWRNLLVDTLSRDRATVYPGGGTRGDPTVVASSQTSDRPDVGNWRVSVVDVGVDGVDDGDDQMLVVEADSGGYEVPLLEGPIIRIAAEESLIIATGIAADGARPTRLRLIIGGADTAEQEVTSIDVAGGIPVAALAFDTLGAYRLELLDASGAVIATATG